MVSTGALWLPEPPTYAWSLNRLYYSHYVTGIGGPITGDTQRLCRFQQDRQEPRSDPRLPAMSRVKLHTAHAAIDEVVWMSGYTHYALYSGVAGLSRRHETRCGPTGPLRNEYCNMRSRQPPLTVHALSKEEGRSDERVARNANLRKRVWSHGCIPVVHRECYIKTCREEPEQ